MPRPTEPLRAVAFFDGQNLFRAAKEAFGYGYPNYHPVRLAEAVCVLKEWKLEQVRFYTGIPDDPSDSRRGFWDNKLAHLGRLGVHTFKRETRYGREKGVDLRIALDAVRLALDRAYDVAVFFSQDQDLTELVDDVLRIARDQRRFIKLASAFPVSSNSENRRGIDRTDWIRIGRETYDACLDSRDYRPKRKP